MKKILLAGASTYGVKNMGDDAMLYNLTQTMHRNIDCEITFLARHPEGVYDEIYGIKSIKNYEHDSKKDAEGRWFNGFNRGDSGEHLAKIREKLEGCDLVIIGGNSFMEVSANQFMRGVAPYSALLATLAIFHQKPYVLYGVAGHELKNDYTKELARYLCGNAELVTVREDFYKNVLADAGATGDHIQVWGDPAFGIDAVEDLELGESVLKKENIKFNSEIVVGVGFRHMYWKWTENEFSEYSRKIAHLCDFIVEEYKAEILFIPNCTYNVDTPYEDDRYIAKHVIDKMTESTSAHLIETKMDLIETLSLYQHIDMLISNRRHSNIFGAVHYKPIFAFSTGHPWQFKPFISDLQLGDYYASLTEDSLDQLKEKVNTVWENRDEIANVLKDRIPKLKKRAHQQVEAIIDIIENNS